MRLYLASAALLLVASNSQLHLARLGKDAVEQSESAARNEGPPDVPRWTILKPDGPIEEYGSDEELRRVYVDADPKHRAVVEKALAYVEQHTSSD